MNIMLSMLAESSEGGVIDRMQNYVATDELTVAQQQLADPDYWSSVGILTITGLIVVFAILGLLIAFFYGLGAIFSSIDKKKAAKKAAETAAKEKAVVSAPIAEEAVVADEEDDEEIVAVISAAIAAFAEEEGTSYTIKNIRRKGDDRGRSAWSMAGITSNMRQF